jgi:hypothetical protein
MVELRVDVPDAVGVHGLVRRLAVLFDRTSVSFDRARSEVRVRSEWESRAVVQVIDAVEAWLDESGLGSSKLWLGDRSFTVVGQASVTSAR